MANAPRKRNPYIGLLMGLVFVGFGAYRLYVHFVVGPQMVAWRVWLTYVIVAYGLFVLGSLVYKCDE